MFNEKCLCVCVCGRGRGSSRKVSVDNLRLKRLWVPEIHSGCFHFTVPSVLDPVWAGVSQAGLQRPTRENTFAQSSASNTEEKDCVGLSQESLLFV